MVSGQKKKEFPCKMLPKCSQVKSKEMEPNGNQKDMVEKIFGISIERKCVARKRGEE